MARLQTLNKEEFEMPRRFSVAIYVVALVFAGMIPRVAAAAQDASSAALEGKLKQQYKPDMVLVVQKEGIVGVSPPTAVVCPTNFKDNALHPPNALCLVAVKNNSKLIGSNTKVHPTGVSVNLKNEKVSLSIVECDSCNGVQEPSSFKAQVVFQFPKGYLESAEVDQVQGFIAQVLAEDSGGGDQQQGGDAQAQQQAPQQNAAPAQAPAEIKLGQTPDQVQASFGAPDKIVNLGPKQIYVYKDLKVTFINGKVVNVQ
jgi:hypothetical protein